MKTCVLIPAYNEAKKIAGLLSEIRQYVPTVLVVDDGSVDETCGLARASGATVLRNEKNKGKGASLIAGFRWALENNFEAVITMDADGQHQPGDIPYFLRLANHSPSGIFIGNRMYETRGMPAFRLLTNRAMSWLISKLTRQKIPDTQCGFRMIKRRVLENLDLKTCNYETESEILIQAGHLGFKIESIPIKTIYSKEKSRINPLLDSYRFIRFMLKELLERRT